MGGSAEDGMVVGGVDGGCGAGGGLDFESTRNGQHCCRSLEGGREGIDYIGGESEFDSSSRREGGSSRRRMGARLWAKEKGMLVVNWVDMMEGG